MRTILTITFISISIVLSAQYRVMKKADHHINLKTEKIVLLEPYQKLFIKSATKTENYEINKKRNEYFNQLLEAYSKKQGINFDIIKLDSADKKILEHYNTLVQFDNHCYNVFTGQYHLLNKNLSGEKKSRYKKLIYNVPPKIHPEYAYLKRVFNSRYVATMGAITWQNKDNMNLFKSFVGPLIGKKESYMYLLITDLLTGEIVYNIVKGGKFAFNDNTLPPIIFETLNIFKETCQN